MRVLLVRPHPTSERFGLGPFFRVEPLGLLYVGAALRSAGHEVALVDLRFERLARTLRRYRPEVVAISSIHTLDAPATLEVAREVKSFDPSVRVVVGGHSATVHPEPFRNETAVDAILTGDGEASLVNWLAQRGALGKMPPRQDVDLDRVPLPARDLVAKYRSRYLCVHKMDVYAVETSRGCPYRCSFCSITNYGHREFRTREIRSVVADIRTVGENVFVIDDLFWHPGERSLELAKALLDEGVRKNWVLVQTRLDTMAKRPSLLEAWRPISKDFDVFCGFEAASEGQLARLHKDTKLDAMREGVKVARQFGYGVTGNFVIDPDWEEADFEAMWDLVDTLRLRRVGYTILTPLPGTPLFERERSRLVEQDLGKFDMQHILYEPKLGRARFFELFVESWKRNVLSSSHASHWVRWLRGLTPRQAWTLLRVLWKSQQQLSVKAYLNETFPLQIPAGLPAE